MGAALLAGGYFKWCGYSRRCFWFRYGWSCCCGHQHLSVMLLAPSKITKVQHHKAAEWKNISEIMNALHPCCRHQRDDCAWFALTFRDWTGETKVCSREAAYFQSDLLDFRQDKAGDWLVKVRALR
ncbi:hypothetical protein S101447_00382 [Acetobacter ascendens]|uniref:Uncharacterized protein n=1 Tax=Acetobacter ascendens TaxID=481146 RepID=A0A1Y0V3R1_9PROT|nr:hypothetical protein S101447_00382 [Acetobacter ascendens]